MGWLGDRLHRWRDPRDSIGTSKPSDDCGRRWAHRRRIVVCGSAQWGWCASRRWVKGHPALFINGASNAGTSWMSLMVALEGFRCIALDRPGCGLSDPIAGGSLRDIDAVESYADELLGEVLDRARVGERTRRGDLVRRLLRLEGRRRPPGPSGSSRGVQLADGCTDGPGAVVDEDGRRSRNELDDREGARDTTAGEDDPSSDRPGSRGSRPGASTTTWSIGSCRCSVTPTR